jgi:hypothetical protein
MHCALQEIKGLDYDDYDDDDEVPFLYNLTALSPKTLHRQFWR